jgi:hypothetical protein
MGFCDECWWSRLALPTLSSWAEEGKPLRLVHQSVAKDDPEPKAVSCYGLYVPEEELPKESVVKVGKLFTTHRSLIASRFGIVKEEKLREVLGRLRALFAGDDRPRRCPRRGRAARRGRR